ncbi:hypothetical protein [Erythrobacter rubeus]|uniref:GlsB/YeaQ/YmgE family stress response membrane protein n=1 Tax=Erythrobacter rubeus TaxID=2760803 RepID=A0ABR8KQL9_9SPHN|nr:hypothetical protein [Erythrobacter rubeus]MBD2843024.1 hypothetical protein [Erythrobacter rubeus]
MALLVLIVMGATLGWLASIIARTEDSREILRQIGIGIAATLLIGLIFNSGTILGGLSLMALVAALVSGSAALILYHTVLRPRLEA